MLQEVTNADAIEWDVATWSAALRFWERQVKLGPGTRCLDVGARRGGLSLWLASKGATVTCTDLSNPAHEAGAYHARFRYSGTISYASLDALDMPFGEEFDVVVFKSVLGGIGRDGHPERQRAALRQMHKVLRPGGCLLIAENLAGSPLHTALRRKFVPWGRSWQYVTVPELRGHLTPFRRIELHTRGFLGALGRSEASRRALAYVDSAFDRLVPVPWRYIVYGIGWK